MSDDTIRGLLQRAPFSFLGTVEHVGGATMTDIPIDARTAVVHVDHVLHAPDDFARLEGHRVTLQLAADADPPAVGQTDAFFAEGLAFGETVALREIGRLSYQEVEPHITAALATGPASTFATLRGELAQTRLTQHADQADAIVLGRVTRLEKSVPSTGSEHDPDWWRATLDVRHVERGDVPTGPVEILYPNSLDVRWHSAPKPAPGQDGVWILHATEGPLREAAPFQILHPEDYQPLHQLDVLRGSRERA